MVSTPWGDRSGSRGDERQPIDVPVACRFVPHRVAACCGLQLTTHHRVRGSALVRERRVIAEEQGMLSGEPAIAARRG